jgi:hypothetical protein
MKLEPGESTTLHLDIDLSHRRGPQRFFCSLVEGDGNEWVYKLETMLYEHATLAGSETVHFGMVDPGTSTTRETRVLFRATKEEDLPTAVAVRSESDEIRATAGKSSITTTDDGILVRTFPVRMVLERPEKGGFSQSTVQVDYERAGMKSHLRYCVTWNVKALLTAAPAQVYFGKVDGNSTPVERRVLLQRGDGKSVRVAEVKSPHAALRSELQQQADGRTMLRLTEFLAHYHEERPHQGLGNVPLSGPPPSVAEAVVLPLSEVRCRERLGGLLKHYRRAA